MPLPPTGGETEAGSWEAPRAAGLGLQAQRLPSPGQLGEDVLSLQAWWVTPTFLPGKAAGRSATAERGSALCQAPWGAPTAPATTTRPWATLSRRFLSPAVTVGSTGPERPVRINKHAPSNTDLTVSFSQGNQHLQVRFQLQPSPEWRVQRAARRPCPGWGALKTGRGGLPAPEVS